MNRQSNVWLVRKMRAAGNIIEAGYGYLAFIAVHLSGVRHQPDMAALALGKSPEFAKQQRHILGFGHV